MIEHVNNCPCNDKCPLEQSMEIIGGKWKIQIICALYNNGVTRYNELKRSIKGVSNTMLASSLKELEKDGLIIRKQYMEVPVRVEYEVTNRSKELIPILKDLAMWGMKIKDI